MKFPNHIYSNIFLTQSKITFPKLHKFKQQKWPDRVQLANRSLWIFVGCPAMRTKTQQEKLKISTQLSGLASHRGARGWQEYSMDLTRWPSPSQKWVVKPFVKVWTLSFSTTLRLWQLFDKMRKKICILSHWKKVKKKWEWSSKLKGYLFLIESQIMSHISFFHRCRLLTSSHSGLMGYTSSDYHVIINV